jgi:site-specific recombinase XerD
VLCIDRLLFPKILEIICPFLNVSEYLAIRPKSTATKPLFCHYNGTILTRQQFSALLSKSLKFSGIEGGQYKAHSFRIGGASFND